MALQHPAMTALCFQLLVVLFMAALSEGAEWSYDTSPDSTTGPAKWEGTCKKQKQSPIDLDVKGISTTPLLTWSSYNLRPLRMKLANNGHSLVITAEYKAGTRKPQIQLASDQIYQLDNVHFHWGKSNIDGSEHTFRGYRYPLEMHAVHKQIVDGVIKSKLLVVGVLFDIGQNENLGLQRFINNAKKVVDPEKEYELPPFNWSDLIPEFRSYFYLYDGSLTTPPCSEGVTWIVRRAPAEVSNEQMTLFRLLKNDDGQLLAGNFRPTQDANGRSPAYVNQ